jgi:hypothetical protein
MEISMIFNYVKNNNQEEKDNLFVRYSSNQADLRKK